jgi:hypothetical protein
MSEMAWKGTTGGPAPVAVHDDGDVAWHPGLAVEWWCHGSDLHQFLFFVGST